MRPRYCFCCSAGKLLLAALLCLSLTAIAADPPISQLGVLAFRPKAKVIAQWQPLVDYLNHSLTSHRIELKALNYPELELAIAEHQLDFVLTNPAHYVQMTFRNGLSSPLATLMPFERGHPSHGFGGVIFVQRSRNDLNQLSDLKGKTLSAVTTESLGGYQAQAMELMNAGVRIPQDVKLIETGMPHDQVVNRVLSGEVDAGFVRTSVLEGMAKEGRLDLRRLKILNSQNQPGFPFLLSTSLYPEWPFAVMP
jgi:ABC-type phosphate/phosphonate transport system substrate-binding protein